MSSTEWLKEREEKSCINSNTEENEVNKSPWNDMWPRA